MSLVLLVAHGTRDDAVELAAQTAARLHAAGTASKTIRLEGRPVDAELDEAPEGTTLVVSLGGDGTFLRASRLARHAS
ncbi:MAG TPA: hypothetical protein VKT18_00365, partial [Acidimicrobiales bacterium]|nr:hypothetical protein [Acidimicrobiales bacterium]